MRMRLQLRRCDDKERVAVGVAQPYLRGDAGERSAAPPDHVALRQWSLVHVDPWGAEGR